MDDKIAIEVLKSILKKHPLNEKEREAVLAAIGILAWTKLAEGRMKGLKKRRDARTSEN
jgi:hypothetical protein